MNQRVLAGWALVVLGGLGLLSAAALAYERFRLFVEPDYVPSCSINPIISCGSVMTTDQASVFGFPNPLLGLVAFAVVLTSGVVLIGGARLPRWYWGGLAVGCGLGLLFVHWLIFQSLYRIGALCPYCMVVWAVQLPLFVVALRHVGRPGAASRSRFGGALYRWRWNLVALWYAGLVLLILERFWDYWRTLL
ncbi:vitamin K epoxide reductase family protein [Hoyosella subflava]|uniref:Conserved integral membrane protein n=1 Tax=Hoyosella subflava (strain DSM 45089 / JCM 17490 / NBRC 109087 / DQS3-9A1) TaxID=443218 RepID=F6EJ85_HOYSD|nr:vitamin K epoxide reductase family protein [Hoyosella subflava]AEF42501.1 Conserved integral membrane protein [Hoyosella subflava DQS3-9A1]